MCFFIDDVVACLYLFYFLAATQLRNDRIGFVVLVRSFVGWSGND
jgi:hypothetical protein